MSDKFDNIKEATVELPEPVTCPSRFSIGPWERKKGLDRWLQHANGDRVCSFCGSLHFDDFKKLVKLAEAPDSTVQIEPSDKKYKIYVRRPEVSNALEGGIKFYTDHLPVDENGELAVTEQDNMSYKSAVASSQHRFYKSLRKE